MKTARQQQAILWSAKTAKDSLFIYCLLDGTRPSSVR